jgi:hypothetical protein
VREAAASGVAAGTKGHVDVRVLAVVAIDARADTARSPARAALFRAWFSRVGEPDMIAG